ncbi:hypothetical protein S40293_06500 [Stachybotrys chartarum IBT 40293]|nr:hypothetical protein S40293_06500 [Stachybotrys chartarum IBT 40293]
MRKASRGRAEKNTTQLAADVMSLLLLQFRHHAHTCHRNTLCNTSSSAAFKRQQRMTQRSHHGTPAGILGSVHSTDGTVDRMLRQGQKQKHIPAIFIHAGAGFHSHQNEHIHLQACVAAAEMGMKFLRAGATATEAIEAALRVLEDKEITNAGYGSNLSIDGTVECDATIVDYLGRSGACGAVPNIRNPISLAKLILDTSTQPLTLRRVPPNALVGEGARLFAEEHGMVTHANEYLVSKNARDRFVRWQEDLKRAEAKLKESRADSGSAQVNPGCTPCQYDTASSSEPPKTFPRDHAAAIMAGTWNEGQPDSPYTGTPGTDIAGAPESSGYFRPSGSSPMVSPMRGAVDRLQSHPIGSMTNKEGTAVSILGKIHGKPAGTSARVAGKIRSRSRTRGTPESSEANRDGSISPVSKSEQSSNTNDRSVTMSDTGSLRGIKRPLQTANEGRKIDFQTDGRTLPGTLKEDFVTDTIGAIAVDDQGRIAAGSSSGGIGMKHRGRLGPAALVGIGTAVVPGVDDDEESSTVAAVTSGTGEHMATTMASQRCAERIYFGTRRGSKGADIHDDDEDAIMESFVAEDFMNHPGVKNCHSAGAIGVMVVKKTRTGYYLYFAHNTDSFALASMGAQEKEPRCTMSRLAGGAKIAKGGRKIRIL